MLKKLLIFLFILIILCAGAYFYFLSEKRIIIKPYPYTITTYKVDGQALAEKADVLIIGDRMGVVLDKEIKDLELATQRTFYNWAKPHEGLHRTLYKLKLLTKIPAIIIYHGASEELLEKKFNVFEKSKIEKNFATYEDDKIISLIITFPILSKYYYQKINYIDLGPITENKEMYSPEEKINQKHLSFQIFTQEIKDLIELAQQNKSKLIFITTPLNSNIGPKEICAHANTTTIQETQIEIEKFIQEGQFKEAYSLAQKLSNITISNAQSFYLLGLAARGAGDQQASRLAFQKASAFDCINWRGNAVYNSIIIKEGRKNLIPVIDFDLQINAGESPDKAFSDEIYPKAVFYQSLAKELGETIKLISQSKTK